MEMRKTQIFMNEPVYLGLSVIGIMKDELDDKIGWILSKNLQLLNRGWQ